MANEALITLTGNATEDATLRFTPNGAAVANVSVAVTPREKVGDSWQDGQAAFYRVAAWRDMAEHVAESVKKGDRVTVVGRLKPREYEHNGEKRTSLDVDADSVALDLRFRTALAGPKKQQGGQQPGGGWNNPPQQQQQSGGWQQQPTQGGPRQSAEPAQQAPAGGGWGGPAVDNSPPF